MVTKYLKDRFSNFNNKLTLRDDERYKKKRHEFLANEFSDHSANLRSIFKNVIYVLIFFVVIGGSFWLGRITANPTGYSVYQENSSGVEQSENSVETVDNILPNITSEITPEVLPKIDLNSSNETNNLTNNISQINDSLNNSVNDLINNSNQSVNVNNSNNLSDNVDYESNKFIIREYSHVNLRLNNFNFTFRGSNWGSINLINISITNNEKFPIYPQMLNVKVYPLGEKPPTWTDAEVDLSEMNIMVKNGEVKNFMIPIHVSFSDVGTKQNILLQLMDLYGENIASNVKQISVS